MSVFEVQVRASSFLLAQRRRLEARQLCPAPVQIGQRTLQLQRVRVGANALRHDKPATFEVWVRKGGPEPEPTANPATGFATQIAQNVVLEIVDLDEVRARPNGVAAVTALPLTAVITLLYYPAHTGGCLLSTQLSAVEWGPTPPLPPGIDEATVQQEVTKRLREALASKAAPFNFANTLGGGPARVENAGVSVDAQGQRVVFRVTPGGADSEQPWSDFHRGAIPDRLGPAEWVYFVDSGILEGNQTFTVESAIRSGGSGSLKLISVGSTYSAVRGVPRVETTVYANVDLPDPLGMQYVEPTIRTEYSAGGPNRLVADVYLPDVKELIEQGLSGVRAALRNFGGLGLLMGDLIVGAAWSAAPGIPAPTNPTCAKVGDRHNRCEIVLPGLPTLAASATFTTCTAEPDGMALSGRLGIVPFTPSELEVGIEEFSWYPPQISCGQWSESMMDDFRDDAASWAVLEGRVRLTASATAPIYYCGFEVLNDPQGIFPAGRISVDRTQLPATITIRIPNPAVRYPLDLLVTTTAGVRLVRLAPPPVITPSDVDRMAALIRASLSLCTVALTTLEDLAHLRPVWLDDPYPDELGQHYWEFELTGLDSERSVVLAAATGDVVMEARALSDVPLRLSALAAGTDDLTLQLSSATGRAAPLSGVDFRQQPVWTAAVIPLEAAGLALRPATGLAGADVLTVTDGGGVTAFSLANPFVPTRVASWSVDGLRGAFALRDQVVGFGEDGFTLLNQDRRPEPAGHDHTLHPGVLDAVAANNLIFAVTPAGLEVRSLRLRVLTTLDLDGARCVGTSGTLIIVGGCDGLRVYDVSEDPRPRLVVEERGPDVVGLAAPLAAPSGSTLAVLADGSAVLLGVRGRVQRLATYPRVPWFVDSLRLGRRLLQLEPDRRALRVGVLGESRLVVPFRA